MTQAIIHVIYFMGALRVSIQRLQMWPHLAEAALAQHHYEVKIGQFHVILVAVGVEPGCSSGRLALCVLAWTNFSPLEQERENNRPIRQNIQHTGCKKPEYFSEAL